MPRPDRDPIPRHGAESRAPRLTFGPGLGLWFGAAFLLAVAAFLLSRLPDLEPGAVLLGVALAGGGVLLPLLAWERYRLDGEGLERRTLSRRGRWAWEALGGVKGTEIGRDDAPGYGLTTGSVWEGYGRRTVVRYEVVDADGRVLFRIGPWTGRRRQLAAEIRRRASAARHR